MANFILASASPRRAELLNKIGLEFTIIPSNIEEVIDDKDAPADIVKKLSEQKAQDVAEKIRDNGVETIVIGADTIVVTDKILGKPVSREHAFEMLNMLQGRRHKVITGVTIVNTKTFETISDIEETYVYMRKLTPEEINTYLDTGEPFDKAGAYGIQGIGSLIIEKIEGCYFNVVGFPLSKFSKMLLNFNIKLL